MARRQTINPLQRVASNGSMTNLGDPNDPTIPESYRDRTSQLYQDATAQLGNSFHARHPVLSGFANAGIGLLSGNPAAAITTPIMGNNKEAQRKLGIAEAYKSALATLSGQQKDLLPTQEASSRGHALGGLLQNSGYESPVADYAPIDQATVKDLLNGILAGDTADSAMTRQTNALRTGVGIGQDVLGGQSGMAGMQRGMSQPAGLDTSYPQPTEDSPLQGNVNASPLALPQYRNPDIVKAGLDNANVSTIAGFKGLPEYQKLPFETQKLIDEAMAANALGGLRQQETITERSKPGLIQSQIQENRAGASLKSRTDPNLRTPRAPNIIDLMTPEQRATYAQRTAQGASPDDGYESVTYDENGKVKTTSSRRKIRGGSGGAMPSQRPMVHGIPIE